MKSLIYSYMDGIVNLCKYFITLKFVLLHPGGIIILPNIDYYRYWIISQIDASGY